MRHFHGEAGLKAVDLIAYTSKLSAVNPMLKIVFSLLLMVICIAAKNVPTAVFTAALAAFTVIVAGKTGAAAYFSVLKVPLGFLLVGGAAIAIDFSGMSAENFYRALRVTVTALGSVSAMLMLTLTTPVSEITDALERMHIPRIFIELMNMIYRFIFVMSAAQAQMTAAAKSRLGYCDFKTGLKTFGKMLGNLLIVSLMSANAYYDAMRARCYDGRLAFLHGRKPVKIPHAVFCICGVLASASIWIFTR